jgi:hypothetical protein
VNDNGAFQVGGRFRKKPVVIEAHQWWKNGDHPEDNCETFTASGSYGLPAGTPFQGEGKVVRYYRLPELGGEDVHASCGRTMHAHGWIDTLEGGHIVCPGDWIITGIKGERYPCKPDIFAATYEPVPLPLPAEVG